MSFDPPSTLFLWSNAFSCLLTKDSWLSFSESFLQCYCIYMLRSLYTRPSFLIARFYIKPMQSSSHTSWYVSLHASIFRVSILQMHIRAPKVTAYIFFGWERSMLLAYSATYDLHSSKVSHWICRALCTTTKWQLQHYEALLSQICEFQ